MTGESGSEFMVKLNGVKPGTHSASHVGVSVYVPTNRELKFSCHLRGEKSAQKLNVNAFAYDSANTLVASWGAATSVGKDEWKEFSATYVAPANVKWLTVWIVNGTTDAAFVMSESLKRGNPAKPDWAAQAFHDPTSTNIISANYQVCLDPLHLRCIMPGAAFLSGFEVSKELMMDEKRAELTSGSNQASVEAQIGGTPAGMKLLRDTARQNFSHFISSDGHVQSKYTAPTQAILSAISSGKAGALTSALADRMKQPVASRAR
jgi:hypothetical protein